MTKPTISEESKKLLMEKITNLAMNGNVAAASIIFNNIDTRYKFRPVRGTFEDAMGEIQFFFHGSDLLKSLESNLWDITTLKCEYQCRDNRDGWEDDSWILITKWIDGTVAPIGYCNYEITKNDMEQYLKEKEYQKKLENGEIYAN